MKGCKYCITPHQDILTFTVGEDTIEDIDNLVKEMAGNAE